MTAPATEKAAPIPADVLALADATARTAWKSYGKCDLKALIARAIMQDRADRASQEERFRQDEREAVIDLIASWPEIGGYTGDLRQSILSTVLDRDAAIIQAIRERGVMSAAIPEKVLELAMDAEVAIRNEDDHPTDIIARVIMRAAEDERDRLFAELDGDGFANSGARAWFREQGAMLPADRARLRGGAS